VLLDVVPGRSEAAVAAWLAQRPQAWLDGISVAAVDPHQPYRKALIPAVGNATVVVDHFHAIALANRVIDEVRRRVQQDTLGHRGRKDDPLYRIRRLLLRGAERLDERAWSRLEAGLAAGDPHGETTGAFLGKELLRDVYAAASLNQARRRLIEFYWYCADADIPELIRLASMISKWEKEVLAYHTTGLSNGPTEAVNVIVEKTRRIGHGFRNFANYRLRLLLRCGNLKWDTHRTARIRGRHPSLVA
jgi:transposase